MSWVHMRTGVSQWPQRRPQRPSCSRSICCWSSKLPAFRYSPLPRPDSACRLALRWRPPVVQCGRYTPDRSDDRAGSRHRTGRIARLAVWTMSMVGLRLSRAFVTAATVSLVVLVAQSLPVSADGGDTLLDNLRSVRSTLDEY